MSTLIEANLFKVGGVSLSGAKFEVNFGKKAPHFVSGLPLPLRELGQSPSPLALLSWHARSSDFFGRGDILQDLTVWCDAQNVLSLRLILGDGGMGKSRLAAELALRMRTKKWDAGLGDTSAPPQASSSKSRLIILDYVDEDLADLENYLVAIGRLESSAPVRILCLARRASPELADILKNRTSIDFYDGRDIHLGGVSVQAAFNIYNSAVEKIGAATDAISWPVDIDTFRLWISSRPEHATPLYLVAAAAYACAAPTDPFVKISGHKTLAALVTREIERLRRLAVKAGLNPLAFVKLAAISILQNGVRLSQAPVVEDAVDGLGGVFSSSALHAACRVDGDRLHFGYPDIIAACILAEALRLADSPEDVVYEALRLKPQPIERSSRLAADAHAVNPSGRSPMIEAILACLPKPDRFRSFFVAIARRRAGHFDPVLTPVYEALWRRQANLTSEPFEKSCMLNNVAMALSDQGKHAAAINVLEKAIRLQENDDQRRPELRARYNMRSEMAVKKLNLGRALVDTGRHRQARMVLEQATTMQRLAIEDGADGTPEEQWHNRAQLWMIYDHLGRALQELNDPTLSSNAYAAGIALYRETKAAFPHRPRTVELGILINAAGQQAVAGDMEGALSLMDEVEAEVRAASRKVGTPDQGLWSAITNLTGFVADLAWKDSNRFTPEFLDRVLVNANEAWAMTDQMTRIVPHSAHFAGDLRYHRAALLNVMGLFFEFESALVDILESGPARSGRSVPIPLVAACYARSLALSFDAENAERLFRAAPIPEDVQYGAWAAGLAAEDQKLTSLRIWRRNPDQA